MTTSPANRSQGTTCNALSNTLRLELQLVPLQILWCTDLVCPYLCCIRPVDTTNKNSVSICSIDTGRAFFLYRQKIIFRFASEVLERNYCSLSNLFISRHHRLISLILSSRYSPGLDWCVIPRISSIIFSYLLSFKWITLSLPPGGWVPIDLCRFACSKT